MEGGRNCLRQLKKEKVRVELAKYQREHNFSVDLGGYFPRSVLRIASANTCASSFNSSRLINRQR